MQRGQHKNVVFLVPSHDSNKKIGRFPKKKDFGPKIVFLAQKICIWPIRAQLILILILHSKDLPNNLIFRVRVLRRCGEERSGVRDEATETRKDRTRRRRPREETEGWRQSIGKESKEN